MEKEEGDDKEGGGKEKKKGEDDEEGRGKGKGEGRVLEMRMSIIQAVILLLFNEEEKDMEAASSSSSSSHIRISLDRIRNETLIPMEELRLAVASICTNKARILKLVGMGGGGTGGKEEKGKEKKKVKEIVKEEEEGEEEGGGDKNIKLGEVDWVNLSEKAVLEYNPYPRTKRSRIVVNQYQVMEKPGESKATHQLVMEYRDYEIDAAIVRIMKGAKKMRYQEMVGRVMSEVRISPHKFDLKKRLESLIERGYVERDEKNNDVILYCA